MRKIKAQFKKFTFIRLYHKKLKKRYWKVKDYFYAHYCSFKGYPVIKTHFARLHNFGDQLNVDVLMFFGYKLLYVPNWKTADVALTGSILQHYHKDFNGAVLGAGFIDQKYSVPFTQWDVKILRGPLSAEQCGKTKEEVLFGDPGILASLIFKNNISKKYELGIVPHYVDYDVALKKFENFKNVKVINVRKKPIEVADDIKSCSHIASSSLHGLIFADSFRIPNIHLKFGDLLFGGLHKFNDYYRGMDAQEEVLIYSNDLLLKDIIKHCKLRYSDVYLVKKQTVMRELIKEVLNNIQVRKT